MNKKIIAIVISVLYLVSSFSVLAKAEDVLLISDVDYSNELAAINAINPDYKLPEETSAFTRSEFVKLLIDVMRPQPRVEAETGFEDVDSKSDYASSLKFAKDFEIISVAQNFNPDDDVTYIQAVKMVVSALGYKPLADAKGSYPTGYLAIANDIDLTDGVKGSGDNSLAIADGLKLICNAFDCAVMVQTGFGNDFVYDASTGETFLSYYRKIDTVYGIMNANEYTSLTSANDGLDDGYVKIGIDDFKTKGDFNRFLGYNVKAYVENEDEIIFVQKYETEEYVLNTTDIDRIEGFSVIVNENGKEKKYSIDESFSYIKNGKAFSVTSADFSSCFMFDTGEIILVDNNGDKKSDVVIANQYNYSVVSRVGVGKENIIYDSNSSANSINLDDDVKYKITSNIDGEETSLDLKDITSGMLLAFTVSEDKSLYNIFVCDNAVDGKITAVDSSNDYIYINDDAYKVSEYYKTYYSNISLGTEASFGIGIDGKLVAVLDGGENYMKYGYFVAFSNPIGLSEAQLKIFSQTGEMLILELADKVVIDGTSISASNAKLFLEELDDEKRLIKFSSNSDGELKKVDTFVDAVPNQFETTGSDSNNSLTKFAKANYRFKSGSNIFISSTKNMFSFHLEATTFNFIIPTAQNEKSDDSKYGVVSSSYFENDQTYSGISVFDVDKYGGAGATLSFGNKRSNVSITNYTASAVIEKVTTGLDPFGENALVVYAWRGNRYHVFYSDPELTEDFIKMLNPGDIVRLAADDDNIIVGITRDFNAKTFEFASGFDSVAGILEYVGGIVYSSSGKYMNILTNPDMSSGNPMIPADYNLDNLRNVNVTGSNIVYVDLVKQVDGTILSALPRMSDASGIKSYLDSGKSASYVVSRQYILSPQLTVVYNIDVK